MNQPNPNIDQPKERPAAVTVLAIGVLSITVLSFVRSIYGLSYWEVLEDLLPFSPFFFGLIGIIWGFLTGISVWGLLRAERWAPIYTRWITGTYLVYFWLDKYIFQHPDNRNLNILFQGIVSILALVYVFSVLRVPVVKEYFGETDERTRA